MKFAEIIWRLEFVQTFDRESVGWPVEPIYIPAVIASPIIRFQCFSETARSSWRVAGEIVQTIGDSRNPDFEGQSITVPLNAMKLLEFSDTVEEYSLKFLCKPWIDSFELKIETPVT